jgi:ribosomal protein L11 methyltransferase
MTTWTALTTLPGEDAARALAEAVEALDPAPLAIGCFEIEDDRGRWEVGAYFDAAPDRIALALLAAAHGAADFTVSELPETDWVAKVRRDLAPVAAGRFFVHGAHDADKVPAGAVPLRIEAAMAFGTGHHGTTRGCLLAIERLAAAGTDPGPIADIGCGTGVLAMAAAHVFAGPVIASDMDAVAVETAASPTSPRTAWPIACDLRRRQRVWTIPALHAAAPFGLVLANILLEPLIALAPDMAAAQRPSGGHAVLSGLAVQGRPGPQRAAYVGRRL